MNTIPKRKCKPRDGGSDGHVPVPDAFLEEAKNEPKRQLISDHVRTITTLREEKRFTFRAIAEWLTKRGIQTDHSSVYRAYLAAIPEDRRDPNTSWDETVGTSPQRPARSGGTTSLLRENRRAGSE